MRQAWRIDRAGSLDRLALVAEPLAPLAAGEVRVAVRAVGLNFADVFACLGLYSATPRGAFVPGLEFAGVVEDPGPATDAATWAPGDAVYGVTRFGGYATVLNVPARQLRGIPRGWSFSEAAAWPAQALTAGYGLVELGRLAPGELALVHSAAGGVGLHALAIAHARGARVVATIGRPEKRELLVSGCSGCADRASIRWPCWSATAASRRST
jgi:alcohol dehydrogenase